LDKTYKIIEGLCAEKGISVNEMCKGSNVRAGIITDYKMNRTKRLSTQTLAKIADYFEVSVDYLLGNTDIKKAPSTKDEGQISDEDLKIALFHGASDVTDEMWEEAKEYARFIYEREQKKREKKSTII